MFWLLVISYWIHLLATAVWATGLILLGLLSWAALRKGVLLPNQPLHWQKRLLPWLNGSLMLLLITGFYQMTNDENYQGFLTIDGVWAWAMLIKHLAYLAIVVFTAYHQFVLFPQLDRVQLLLEKRPSLAANEQQRLRQREKRLLQLNAISAAAVFFCTALATAV